MSWWIGLNREELNLTSRFKEFKQLPKSYIVEPTVYSREPRTILNQTREEHCAKVKAVADKWKKLGLCVNGGHTKTQINPKTGKHYQFCKECEQKRYKSKLRRNKTNRV